MMLKNQSSMMLIVRTARRTTEGENLLNRDSIVYTRKYCYLIIFYFFRFERFQDLMKREDSRNDDARGLEKSVD